MTESIDAANRPPQIITLGHPVLRQTARPVDNVQSPKIQQLIDHLIRLTQERNGVGIAAPQVGQPIQLMIVASHPTPRYPNAPMMPPVALINPQIISYSDTLETDWEGCLSVPGWRGRVPRHRSVKVAYYDCQGDQQTIALTGFIARIFQHEYDHFQGILFIDRVETPEAIVTEAVYQQILTSNDDA